MTGPTARTLLVQLRTLDHYSLEFHAARYDSGLMFRQLVRDAQSRDLGILALQAATRNIARACVDDGADYGNIPCLGGQPQRVWEALRARFTEGA